MNKEGFTMKHLKGIILNGVWLGNRVIINENFNTLCNLSCDLMQEFMYFINAIDNLENQVEINRYDLINKNIANIEFSNNELHGFTSFWINSLTQKPKLVDGYIKYNGFEENCEECNKQEEVDYNKNEEIIADNIANIEFEREEPIYSSITNEFENFVDIEKIISDAIYEKNNEDSTANIELNKNLVSVEDILLNLLPEEIEEEPEENEEVVEVKDEEEIETVEETADEKETEEAVEDFINKTSEEVVEEEPEEIEEVVEVKDEEEMETVEETADGKETEETSLIDQMKLLQVQIKALQEDNKQAAKEETDKKQRQLLEQIDMMQEQINSLQNENASLIEQLQNSKGRAYNIIKELMEEQKQKKEKEILNKSVLKILGTEDIIDADIIDEGLYLAGDMVYKWGETLYLEK